MQEAGLQQRQEEGAGSSPGGATGMAKGSSQFVQLRAAVTKLAEASALHRLVGRKTILYNHFVIYVLSSPVITYCLIKMLIVRFYI